MDRSRNPGSHKEWVETEGGIEHPTHLETLQKPEQQKRIEWLRKHSNCFPILDVGCNWGYVTHEINAQCGIDKNIENIDKAMREFPLIHWVVADITNGLPFDNKSYGTVVLADVLEHLEWQIVSYILQEALRVTRWKILITIPWRQDCATCFKHQWIPNKIKAGFIFTSLMEKARSLSVECDGNFVYIEALK